VEDLLHPDVARWFRSSFGDLTPAQAGCLPLLQRGASVLLSSPTGTGKTLAGFLGIIDRLYRERSEGRLQTGQIRALYVSPLRALTYDIRKNLTVPLEGLGVEDEILIASRTGDTSPAERSRTKRRPPHVFLTTPESLAIILCQSAYREALRFCETVIVDELHALTENKRGAHLSISLERLEELTPHSLCRVGLSATVAPLDLVAEFLVGEERNCEIVAPGWERESLADVLTPLRKTAYPPAGYTGSRVVQDVARIVESNRTTIIFTNTRSSTENVSMRLRRALPQCAHQLETHHSSLDRDLRLEVVRAQLVATPRPGEPPHAAPDETQPPLVAVEGEHVAFAGEPLGDRGRLRARRRAGVCLGYGARQRRPISAVEYQRHRIVARRQRRLS